MGGGGSTTTVQSADPWAGQQPFLSSLYNTAANLSSYGPNGKGNAEWPQYYPYSQVAGINQEQAAPLWQQYNVGMNGGTGAMQAGNTYEQNVLNGGQLGTNPGSAAASTIGANAMANPGSGDLNAMARGDLVGANAPGFQSVVNNTLANVMPQIESTFAGSGRMDSGAAARAAAQGATDAIGNLEYGNYNTQLQNQLAAAGQLSQNYNTGIGNQLGAAGLLSNNYANEENNQRMAALMAPSYDAQTMQDLNTAQNLGNSEQGNVQQQINADMAKWNYGQMLPWNIASMYQGLIAGNPGSTQSTYNAMGGGASNFLSGAAGTVGLLNGINSLTAAPATATAAASPGIISSMLAALPDVLSSL